MTTIKDIAKRVGVSPSTVSRVINGTASISEETKKKIHAAMKEMDYHPNSLARSLVNGNSFTIGLVIDAGDRDAFSNAFFIQSVSAIEMVTQERGYNLLITNDTNGENNNTVKNLVLEHKVDGIILPVSSMKQELIELMTSNHFPFVVMGEPNGNVENICWVDMDNEQGGSLAVDHLLQQGYQHPVLFVENKGTMFEKKRIMGFKNGYEKNNMIWDACNIVECGSDNHSIISQVKKILNGEQHVDSIICTNNIVAYHVLHQLKKGGKMVPEDVGVMTFDNFPLAEYMEPALTVVDVDTYKLGEQAAIALFDEIKQENEQKETTRISTRIIPRKSTIHGKEACR